MFLRATRSRDHQVPSRAVPPGLTATTPIRVVRDHSVTNCINECRLVSRMESDRKCATQAAYVVVDQVCSIDAGHLARK